MAKNVTPKPMPVTNTAGRQYPGFPGLVDQFPMGGQRLGNMSINPGKQPTSDTPAVDIEWPHPEPDLDD